MDILFIYCFSKDFFFFFFFFSSRRRHTRSYGDWSSDVCSSDLSAKKSFARSTPTCFSATSAGKSSRQDRKSTRLNSSHRTISYAVFCLKKKKHQSVKNDNPTISMSHAHCIHQNLSRQATTRLHS